MKEKNELHIKKEESWKMFNSIASTYNCLNSVLSVGILRSWRLKLVNSVPKGDNLNILDCATGTGEVMFSIMKKRSLDIQKITGIDLAQKMMDEGINLKKGFSYANKIHFRCESATEIPFDAHSFDCVSMAFGIRNVDNHVKCLEEISRVLKPGGVALIMEFSLPKNRVIKQLYLLYFRYILPFIGGLVSGDYNAYKYLNKTVETFPYGSQFKQLMETVELDTKFKTLTLGIATLYIGTKRAHVTL
jgi:demethylmenaquinone methyltransferase / 2-methoxy-6-polyprenyl-1,4-benzoquinol methylase